MQRDSNKSLEEEKVREIENAANPDEVSEKGSQAEKPLFSQKFYCQDGSSISEHNISITPNYLMVDDKSITNILLSNVFGASTSKMVAQEIRKLKGNTIPEGKDVFRLTVHLFAKYTAKSFFGSKSVKRHQFNVSYYTTEENIANQWRNLILQAANNPKFLEESLSSSVDQIPQFKRHLLVFVNPASGAKVAVARWNKAKPILENAGCTFKEIFTEYMGHAAEYIQKLKTNELLSYDGIVSVSGDGLPHEIINGIFKREDVDQVKHIPLGPLPGGSGNAIVKNLCHRAGEESSLIHACYLIAKGKTTTSDLVVLDVPNKPPIYSFLSLVWAAVANIDIESEKIRWTGGFRFDVWGFFAFLKLRKWRGTLTYSETVNELPLLEEEIKVDENWTQEKETWTYFNFHKLRYITDHSIAAPITDNQDGFYHLVTLKGANNTRGRMLKTLLGLESGLFGDEEKMKNVGIDYKKVKAWRLEVEGTPNNYFSIDGEKYETDKIQGRMVEKALTLFCTQ